MLKEANLEHFQPRCKLVSTFILNLSFKFLIQPVFKFQHAYKIKPWFFDVSFTNYSLAYLFFHLVARQTKTMEAHGRQQRGLADESRRFTFEKDERFPCEFAVWFCAPPPIARVDFCFVEIPPPARLTNKGT